MLKRYLNKKYFYILGLVFVLGIFSFITLKTPLAGDDWCYAVNGRLDNPFVMALNFYKSWSGRYFSELWGFVVTNNRWAWNFINPLLFAVIYLCIYKIADVNNNHLIVVLLILAFILSVDDYVRMETYTWIMGTTYVIPLCISLVYFYYFEKVYLHKKTTKILYLLNPILFVGCLMMENISAAMVIGLLILLIFCHFNKKELKLAIVINLVVCVTGFVIMRLSPGAAVRLARDYPVWSELSLFEKIISDYPSFIQKTFIDNNYMIALLSICLGCLVLYSNKSSSCAIKIICLFIDAIALVSVFSFVLVKENNFMIEGSSLFSKLYWPIYVVMVIVQIWLFVENDFRRNKILFFLAFGGSAALAMIMSPLYGARSSLYTIYYVILISSLIIGELDINKFICVGLCVICLVIIADRTKEYIYKYSLVGERVEQRNEEIEYYSSHPEEEYAGFERFPIYTIHSIDIEWDDMVHFQAFKELYNIPQDLDKIYFYVGEGEN